MIEITEPTRVTSTLKDPISVTNEISVFYSGVLEVNQDISDHKETCVYIKININLNCAHERKVWLY